MKNLAEFPSVALLIERQPFYQRSLEAFMVVTKKWAVREAMEFNRSAIIARRRFPNGELKASIAGFCERRDFLMALARKA